MKDVVSFFYKFKIAYLHDILVYNNLEEHLQHLEHIWRLLQESTIVLNLKKIEFCSIKLAYLSAIISGERYEYIQTW